MARRGKKSVVLLDGPRKGAVVEYEHPLPEVMVIPEKLGDKQTRFHDYYRYGMKQYAHSRNCPCCQPPSGPDEYKL